MSPSLTAELLSLPQVSAELLSLPDVLLEVPPGSTQPVSSYRGTIAPGVGAAIS